MAHEQTLHPARDQQDDDDEDDSINNNNSTIKGEDDGAGEGGKANLKTSSNIGRRKINIEFIEDKGRRHITFSKRKAGIMKKAYELSTLTGTQVLLLVASETGHVYTFSTPKLQPIITKPEGKNLIQACLNAPDPSALPPASPPRGHRIAYQGDSAAVHGSAANLVPFQSGGGGSGGASSDSVSGSYDDYDKEDKERRGRAPEKAQQQASAAGAGGYPSSSALAAAGQHPGGASMGGYPGSYPPLPSSLNHLMSNAQYQQSAQQQSNLYSQMRYLQQQQQQQQGGGAQQYGTHPSQQGGGGGYPPTAGGANFQSALLSQYQSQGYPYWAGNPNANPSEKPESSGSSSSTTHST